MSSERLREVCRAFEYSIEGRTPLQDPRFRDEQVLQALREEEKAILEDRAPMTRARWQRAPRFLKGLDTTLMQLLQDGYRYGECLEALRALQADLLRLQRPDAPRVYLDSLLERYFLTLFRRVAEEEQSRP